MVFADVSCAGAGLQTPGIIACSQVSYLKIGSLLNEQYKSLSSELTPSVKPELLAIQRNWVKLKDGYCAEDKEGGEEAPIDRLSCLKQLTSFRVNELIYFRTGVIGDGFYKAVSLVNEKTTAMNYSKAVDYVGGEMEFGPLWKGYVEQNCALAKKIFIASGNPYRPRHPP
ncbi:lysozyme inhibitor LprI family protein [Pseudomonas cichorii]|uniref:lysozyme inhibitor LprI family protein n=1 Tax=Pseudomonas cichorii TaxID=36746 RepID=UPI001C866DDE|nr:lysozyme inhibitor LprI family protein [Pseudomonas cichorii]MBX8488214.1 lysozyme inhibitor LprI family protein [Pseudomonas cichorii]MBX8498230.1 lysozyme inhibitor LprI family protein [Pseudomonas cichorii]MBX8513445.1 lysozyme inhibitor LprI family protein [Pseudomonas cichorii]MBX8596613.1 lysozyme inhibitor LprI family protein [Pseudomonas cichorii]MBX8615813.1 lysozyme inhibitor LprI family protein [Pseudomonas cichorii]